MANGVHGTVCKHTYTPCTCLHWVSSRMTRCIQCTSNTHILLPCVVAPQVPVSKPHPRSRAQRSHLWVPVTPAGIADVDNFEMDKDFGAKQKTAEATEVENENDLGMRFWALEESELLHVLNTWMDSWSISGINGTNECMCGCGGRKCSSAPWLEPVKLEPAAERLGVVPVV